jgi:CBS domain-containing protein
MKAREIMSSDPVTVAPTDTVARAAEVMRDLRIGAVPVVDDPAIPLLLGIITDRDITVRCTSEGHAPMCLVRGHMTPRPLETVTLDDDVSVVIDKMERSQVRRIPVTSDSGILLGIIAQADIATKVGPSEPAQVEELLERISSPEPVGV